MHPGTKVWILSDFEKYTDIQKIKQANNVGKGTTLELLEDPEELDESATQLRFVSAVVEEGHSVKHSPL